MGISKMFKKMKYGEPIVIVSGLPRSGTSMAMKMLDAAGLVAVTDDIREADVDNPKGYFEDERVKDLYKDPDKSWVRGARGKVLKVISFLLKDLPGDNFYKILFVRRDLEEVLASQNKMLDHRGEESETEDEKMKELYTTHLRQVRSLMEFRDNFDFIEVNHRDMIEKPEESARRISEFLGGGHDVAKMAAVVDRKLYRNRAEAN